MANQSYAGGTDTEFTAGNAVVIDDEVSRTSSFATGTAPLEDDEDVSDEVKAARAHVEQTRAELSSTIEALRDKLSPQHLVAEAKDAVKEAVAEQVESAKEAVFGKAHDAVDSVSGAAASVAGAAQSAFTGAMDAASGLVDQVKSAVTGVASNATHTTQETFENVNDAVAPGVQRAKDTGAIIMDTIKLNPLPAALTGIGLAWLILSIRRQQAATATPVAPNTDGVYDPTRYPTPGYYGAGYGYGGPAYGNAPYANPSYQSYPAYQGGYGAPNPADTGTDFRAQAGQLVNNVQQGAGQLAQNVQQTAGQVVGNVQQTAGQLANNVQQTAGQVAGTVQQTAGQVAQNVQQTAGQVAQNVQQTAGQVAGNVQQTAGQVVSATGDLYNTSPFILGAVALLAGVAVGMLVPATEPENRLMGETRDRLKDQATQQFQQVASRVTDVAQTAIEQVKAPVTDALQHAGDAIAQNGQAPAPQPVAVSAF